MNSTETSISQIFYKLDKFLSIYKECYNDTMTKLVFDKNYEVISVLSLLPEIIAVKDITSPNQISSIRKDMITMSNAGYYIDHVCFLNIPTDILKDDKSIRSYCTSRLNILLDEAKKEVKKRGGMSISEYKEYKEFLRLREKFE